ncbi:hypothetical protein G7Y89_g7530 [Cudoniella acicularis]|uniref:Uncharacterized protein n=1 Tax=Cudoniella acicularis TaxID=354080 RepID=A0A8H4RLV9_9HELO|nr:hypothetical protein G7Y89_g7530 [Cudoniella acicularis]
MHQILSLSAFNIAVLRPQDAAKYRYLSDRHAMKALSLFQPQINNLTETNCQACFLFSLVTFIQAWTSQDITQPSTLFFIPTNLDENGEFIQWARLYRGHQEIIRLYFVVLIGGPLRPLFEPWLTLPEDRPMPLLEEEYKHLSEFTEVWKSSVSIPDTQKEILTNAHKDLMRIFSIFAFEPQIPKLAAVMSWFSRIVDDFLVLLEDKMPEALLIVAYYCVAIKMQSGCVWWLTGKAEHLLRTVLDELGDQWEQWTRWPIEKVLETPLLIEKATDVDEGGDFIGQNQKAGASKQDVE